MLRLSVKKNGILVVHVGGIPVATISPGKNTPMQCQRLAPDIDIDRYEVFVKKYPDRVSLLDKIG